MTNPTNPTGSLEHGFEIVDMKRLPDDRIAMLLCVGNAVETPASPYVSEQKYAEFAHEPIRILKYIGPPIEAMAWLLQAASRGNDRISAAEAKLKAKMITWMAEGPDNKKELE